MEVLTEFHLIQFLLAPHKTWVVSGILRCIILVNCLRWLFLFILSQSPSPQGLFSFTNLFFIQLQSWYFSCVVWRTWPTFLARPFLGCLSISTEAFHLNWLSCYLFLSLMHWSRLLVFHSLSWFLYVFSVLIIILSDHPKKFPFVWSVR